MLKKVTNFMLVLFLITLLFSCDEKSVFDQYKTIENGLWNIDNKVEFSFTNHDTISKRNLFINLRNNNNYEFSNLFLIAKMKFPDGKKVIDTLEYDMTDSSGRFLGVGFTQLKENKLFYKEQIIFPVLGSYTVSIEQAMRKNGEVEGIGSLKGITEVGFRIEKTN